MTHPDTIVAAATPPGRGGVGVVRVSGPKAPEIAATIVGELPDARRARLAPFLDAAGNPIDVGLALFFPGPHSYTGEHVLELQGHGAHSSWKRSSIEWLRSAVAEPTRVNSLSEPSSTTNSTSRKQKPSQIS